MLTLIRLEMEIPQAVKDQAKELIETFGENFEKLGIYQGKQAYRFVFPEGSRTGFPFVYLFDEQTMSVEVVTGIKAIALLSSIN